MKKTIFFFFWALWFLPVVTVHAPPLSPAHKEAELRYWQSKYGELERRASSLQVNYARTVRRIEDLGGRYIDTANICEGRLTLESGVPVSTTDQADKTTLYFTPFRGSTISLYNGTLWQAYRFTQTSLDLTALSLSANTNYDVFAYLNAGNVNIILSNAWASATARADAVATQDGVLVLSGTPARRYVGTIRMSSATQTQDTFAKRFVWNYQNQVQRILRKAEDTGADTWTYAVNGWRQANADGDNRVEYVTGTAESFLHAQVMVPITNGTGTVNYYAAGVGVDSTTVNSALIFGSGSDNDMVNQAWGEYMGYPGLGYHALNWLEISNAAVVTAWGDNGDATKYQSGIMASIWG